MEPRRHETLHGEELTNNDTVRHHTISSENKIEMHHREQKEPEEILLSREPQQSPLFDSQQMLQNHNQKRVLCAGEHNHCFNPEEKNVFSPFSEAMTVAPGVAPTVSPQPTSLRDDETSCKADGQGNYGATSGPSFRTVNYRYQVETTEALTAFLLNVEVLQDVEKAISDIMVQRFFAETCSSQTIDVFPDSKNLIPNDVDLEVTPTISNIVLTKVASPFKDEEKELGDGRGLRKLLRILKSEYHQTLVGISADPSDQVLEGSLGEACPFPTTNGPCFVVGGGVTMFGDSEDGSSSGLLWVDEGVHEELQKAMNSGELEEEVRQEHENVVAIRYIPPGTELPDPTNPDGVTQDPIGGKSTALSWVLIGIGFFILVSVLVYMIVSRRQYKREREEQTATEIGAFPIVVTNQNVARTQWEQDRESNKSRSRQRSSYYPISPESRNDIGSHGSITDDGLHVFHDDEASPRHVPASISTSWRDQILRQDYDNGLDSPLDPNQAFVRPVLNDEQDSYQYHSPSAHIFHSAESQEQGSSGYTGSSLASSPRSRLSPSKLTVAFESGEII